MLSKKAAGQGLRIEKSRKRDPRTPGGYMVVDVRTNIAVYGNRPYAFSATLEEVEEYLKN
jgi:hypothetical protein